MGVGAWTGFQRSGGAVDGYVISWLVGTIGLMGLTAWVGFLFDQNVAKPIATIASELTCRAAGPVEQTIEEKSARHLGALAPAANAIDAALTTAWDAQKSENARATTTLQNEKTKLETLIASLPYPVVALNQQQEVLLYNEQAQRDVGTLLLHRRISPTELPNGVKPVYLGSTPLARSERPPAPAVLCKDLTPPQRWTPKSSLMAGTYVVFDTETTGLEMEKDRMVQLGAVRMVKGRILDQERFDMLVQPEAVLSPSAVKIHGITPDMLRDAATSADVMAQFTGFCEGAVLVAHNAPFDRAMLAHTGSNFVPLKQTPVLCTARLSKFLMPQTANHTLDRIAERYGLTFPHNARHTALGDALITAQVFKRMLPQLQAAACATLSQAIDISTR